MSSPANSSVSPGTATGPRRFLVNDEGNAALHFVDTDAPARNWTYRGPGRDLQLVGNGHLLRSAPQGFVELDLAGRGAVVREETLPDLPGPVESARRLPSGDTVVLGNGGGGIFVWQIDATGRPIRGRTHLCSGIDKGRMLRVTPEGSFLFCSETEGRRIVHDVDLDGGVFRQLFQIPSDVPADSMVKAVRVAPDVITVSTGYAASLIRIDLGRGEVVQSIGGKAHPDAPGATRPLSPFFFSGYQMLPDGAFLISNWQGHSAERNGQGYQLLKYSASGDVVWVFDQARYPYMSSLNNVIGLDGLDISRLHDEPNGILTPIA